MRPLSAKLLRGIKFCKSCGCKMLFQGYDLKHRLTHSMLEKQYCYECAYWQDKIDYPEEYLEVVGERALKILPLVTNRDTSMFLGTRGKMRYFIRNDSSLFKSNDVWLIGIIPERFRSLLKTTAKEITSQAFNNLYRNTKRCHARGCFDRYQCLRYKQDIEKTNGPFNKVPKNWKTGDEHCKYFLNAEIHVINDESNVRKNLYLYGTNPKVFGRKNS